MSRARVVPALVSVALVGATLAPLARSPLRDSFPLSTYPMFAMPRPTQQTLDYAVGDTADGAPRLLAPAVVGTGEVLQAWATIERAVHGPPGAREQLCRTIAARVAADPDYRDVVRVRLVTGTHDAVDYLVRHVRGQELERARCDVPRGGPAGGGAR